MAPFSRVGASVKPGAVHCDVIQLCVLGDKVPVPQARIEFGALNLLGLSRAVFLGDLVPLKATFTCPEPASAASFGLALNCPVAFDCSQATLCLRAEDADRPLPSANPTIASLIDGMLKSYLPAGKVSLSARVKRLLAIQLASGTMKRDLIARQLAMTERSLQRRLAEDGTTFVELRDATRKELAAQWIFSRQLGPTEISYRLGFADPSSFYRAWRRWYGGRPGEIAL